MPIIKLRTKGHVCVDISIADESGPRAARYIAQACRACPPAVPLALVLKSYLRSCGLNEVASGGLSSYSLTNMVLAHLAAELRDGRDIHDTGEALYGFLLRFGVRARASGRATGRRVGGPGAAAARKAALPAPPAPSLSSSLLPPLRFFPNLIFS